MEESIKIEQENQMLSTTGIEHFWSIATRMGQVTTQAHIHNAIEMLYVTEGSFTVFINGEKYTVDTGELVLFPSNTVHSAYASGENGGKYLVLKVRTSVIFDMASNDRGARYILRLSLRQEGQKFVFSETELAQNGIYPLLQEIAGYLQSPCYASDLLMKANMVKICALLLNFYAAAPEKPDETVTTGALQKIYQAMCYVNNNFHQEITAQKCALEVDMGYAYFTRLFKEIVGKGFSAYLNEVRINHAEKALLLTNKSITEICYDCGFNEPSYFIARFKEYRGVTPYSFRKNAYQGNNR